MCCKEVDVNKKGVSDTPFFVVIEITNFCFRMLLYQ